MGKTGTGDSREYPVRRPRGPRTATDEAPLTVEEIVAAGVRLTASRGLAGWSTRDLAAEVGCWPTAIAHRVGARYEVELAVVDAILRQATLPSSDLTWRPWFGELLASLRQVLTAHPGVARWLGVAAPAVPAAVTMMDIGVRKLVEVGLGGEAPAAHVALLNTAIYLIAAEDDRDADPKLRSTIGVSLTALRNADHHPGAALMARVLTSDFGRDDIYQYAVERVLDGVAVRIAALGSASESLE